MASAATSPVRLCIEFTSLPDLPLFFELEQHLVNLLAQEVDLVLASSPRYSQITNGVDAVDWIQ